MLHTCRTLHMNDDSVPVPMDTSVSRPQSGNTSAAVARPTNALQVPLGFHNLGNTCYFNSALQMLLSLPSSLLNLYIPSTDSMSGSENNFQQQQLTSSFNSIRRAYEASFAAPCLHPQAALNAIPLLRSLMDEDELGRQQDASERLQQLLCAVGGTDLSKIPLLVSWQSGDGTPRVEDTSMNMVVVNIDGSASGDRSELGMLIRKALAHSNAFAPNQFQPGCKLPPCLLVGIHRVHNRIGNIIKNSRVLEIPDELRVADIFDCKLDQWKCAAIDGQGKYELYSFIVHKGPTYLRGHYWTVMRAEYNRSDWWIQADDIHVFASEKSTAEILRANTDDRHQPFVLCYVLSSILANTPARTSSTLHPRDAHWVLPIIDETCNGAVYTATTSKKSEDELSELALSKLEAAKVQRFRALAEQLLPNSLSSLDKRDATDTTLRGAYYQVAMTVLRWLQCDSHDLVLMEFGEDVTMLLARMKSITAEECKLLESDDAKDEGARKKLLDRVVHTDLRTTQVKNHDATAGTSGFTLHKWEVAKYLAATVQWLQRKKSDVSVHINMVSEYHTTARPGKCAINRYAAQGLFTKEILRTLHDLENEKSTIEWWNKMHEQGSPKVLSNHDRTERANLMNLFRCALFNSVTKGHYPRQPTEKECPQKWWDDFIKYTQDDSRFTRLVCTVRFIFPSEESIHKGSNNFLDVRQTCLKLIEAHPLRFPTKQEPAPMFRQLCEKVMERCFHSREGETQLQVEKRKVFDQNQLKEAASKACDEARNSIVSLFLSQVERAEFRTCNEYIKFAHHVALQVLAIQPSDTHNSLIDAWGVNMLIGNLFRRYGLVPSPNKSRQDKIEEKAGKLSRWTIVQPNKDIRDFFAVTPAPVSASASVTQPTLARTPHCDQCRADLPGHVCAHI
jgi:hypothetical protein